jgi:preprotein translocase subunit SecY
LEELLNKMLNKFLQIFKIKDLRNKILFIFGIFAIFRFLAHIPIPGVEIKNLQDFFNQFRLLGILNIFTGGALERISIVMLGLGPYITSAVILQLLTLIFPKLEKMYKEEGEEGRKKIEQYSRILTVPIAALQAFGMLTFFARQGAISTLSPLIMFNAVLTITAATLFLMWLGELVTEKGIGNGVSLLIFAGIIADFPSNIAAMISEYKILLSQGMALSQVFFFYFLFILMCLFIITGVAFINEAKREIPVSYAKRVRGRLMYGGTSTYLPLSINPAGVMPIIFALSILTLPSMIANFFANDKTLLGKIAQQLSLLFENPLFHMTLYFILVFLFTYFYTLVTFDPKSISKNLQKSGGFIPGVRPGENTTFYLKYVLNRILPLGALFLGLIAIMPNIVQSITKIKAFGFLVGGTSVLILVSVILDTIRAINAQLEMREYEKF